MSTVLPSGDRTNSTSSLSLENPVSSLQSPSHFRGLLTHDSVSGGSTRLPTTLKMARPNSRTDSSISTVAGQIARSKGDLSTVS
jgi:hypothetical protein